MSLPAVFIRRPVATTLITLGILLSGILAFFKLPVAPLPNIAFPTFVVQAQMAGASPATMASTVAEPLERHLAAMADVTQLTSTSNVGSTQIIVQFGLRRPINGAARDIEAAIQAARADMPASLHSNPTYREFNPASAPIMILALTSPTLTPAQLYDAADTVIEQQLSQIQGVGGIDLGGAALPAVRVDLEPGALNRYGIGLEDVRAAIAAANADSPKGYIDQHGERYQIYSNDQATTAAAFRNLVIAYRKGAAVRLRDVARVRNSVENIYNAGLFNGKPAVIVIIHPSPTANVIDCVDAIKARLPQIEAALPHSVHVAIALDRSVSVRGAVGDTERTLFMAVLLVIGVVYIFLRSRRAILVPAVALPVSIIGTFGPMYLLGYSLDNLSLMALTVATGFVVDDAVVVLENVTRHIEAGAAPREAALRGSTEVAFTVLSMSLSLIAVFLPIILMPGLVGRLFHEFAVTLSIAILISLVVSMTATPALCAYTLSWRPAQRSGADEIPRTPFFARLQAAYGHTLKGALEHPRMVAALLVALIAFNGYLFVRVPKTFFPQQDTGILIGMIQADQSISFQAMKRKFLHLQSIVEHDPAVATVAGYTGGRATNSGFLFVSLKPLSKRHVSAAQVVARLRPRLERVAGAKLFLVPAQDLRVGGRQTAAQFQYTLYADDAATLYRWTPRIVSALRANRNLVDVNSDLQQGGLETLVQIHRSAAARFGIEPSQIDNTLYDAFGQRTVSTIYNPFNQYYVVMELAPRYMETPQSLRDIYVSTAGGIASGTQQTQMAPSVLSGAPLPQGSTNTTTSAQNQATNSIANSGRGVASSGAAVSTAAETMVPLAAFASFRRGTTPIAVNHTNGFVSTTVSFNLPPGIALGQAVAAVNQTLRNLDVPTSIHGAFAGTAQAFAGFVSTEILMIIAAIGAVYIVLGILYESTIHPITILSTIPSAGIGATLALLLLHTPFSIIALIGVLLLIGIVKKNAILMIDFAIQLERAQGLAPKEAIYQGAMLRLRPILMTTAAAVLGAAPLAIGLGEGASLRQPLGITIIGGLILSQILTLYTTPVVYLLLDRFGMRIRGGPSRALPRGPGPGAGSLAGPPI